MNPPLSSAALRRAAAIGLFAATSAFAPKAKADMVPSDSRVIDATFELASDSVPSDVFVVAFPFGSCFYETDRDPQFFVRNPSLDRAERNYEVIRPGVRYKVQKFCFNMELYAFDANGFTTRRVTEPEKLDWYRDKGHESTVIVEFEALKTSQKIDFVRSDRRVRPSGVRIDFPLVVPDATGVIATHDLFRFVDRDDRRMRFSAELTVAFENQRSTAVRWQDRRPELESIDATAATPAPAPAVTSEPPSAKAAAGSLTAPREPTGPAPYFLAGFALLWGGGYVAASRKRARKLGARNERSMSR
jgi:hypothetical protein